MVFANKLIFNTGPNPNIRRTLRFTKPLDILRKLMCLKDALVPSPRVQRTSSDKHKAMVAQKAIN